MTINGTGDQDGSAFNREIKLDPEPASVRKARDFVRANLCELGFPGSAENGVLIASELVTNAVREAPDTPCLVAVRVGAGHPVLEVHDCCADPPEMRAPDFVAEGGRGLHIVDALSEDWDCVQSGGGKAVIVVLPR
jgi:anti-sigma regulatory factor (Ser/Thr protein kinase)